MGRLLQGTSRLNIISKGFGDCYLPALKNIPKWFYLQSNTSLEVKLPDLVSVDNLTIRGNITRSVLPPFSPQYATDTLPSVHLPALTNISTLYIPSWSKDL